MPKRPYTLRDFDYRLPPELIAQAPAAERTGSRLLHVRGAALADHAFADLPRFLAPGDLLVFNDTRVIKARLIGRKATGGRVELLIERVLGPAEALVQIRASHPPRVDGELLLPGGTRATVLARDGRFFRLHFDGVRSLLDFLDRHGEVPLPPYIARPAGTRTKRATRRSTRGTRCGRRADRGAAFRRAARDAGATGVGSRSSPCTSAPARSSRCAPDDLAQHRMHAEWYDIPAATVAAIEAAARAADASSPSERPRCARSRRPADGEGRLRAGAARPTLHHARLPLPGRRPPAHQLPPAEVDAADAGLRLRRRRPRARRLSRTRSPRATGSSATATRCSSNACESS